MMFPVLLLVDVKLIDIALGRMADCTRCPIAIALRRKGYACFTVHENAIVFDNGIRYETPRQAAEFIVRYDTGHHVHASTFYFRRISGPSVQKAVTGQEVALV
ncbi:MAG TPA: hypothetical protein VFG76_08210 [Candidatus Polarisedimenticolia bacterium]|nr:hypothetical protein [Candidatus Polarisedimenticolia bacterium]